MPAFMKILRSVESTLRFCQSGLSAKTALLSGRSILTAAKESLLHGLLMAAHKTAIVVPQISGKADRILDSSNYSRTSRRLTLSNNPLASFGAVLLFAMSGVVAGAQTATTTALTVSPTSAGNGSVFTMTATVTASATQMTGGTVSFRDTYNGISQLLGTVQVQSAHGTAGNAVLMQQLGGIGTHSIVASYSAPKTFSGSSSSAANVTVTGLYQSTASLVKTGGSAGNWSLTATIIGTGTATISPTGTISLLDTSNANLLLGTGALGAGTAGRKTAAASGSPIAVGNKPQSVAAGDFDGDGFIDLAVLNTTDQTITILKGSGTGTFTALTTKPTTGNGPVAVVTGDFDGDGKLDLAIANSTDKNISIFIGNGDGTFKTQVSYTATPLNSIAAIAIGDFNSDGIPDMAVAGNPSTGGAVVIMQNNGSGVFTDVTTSGITVGSAPSSIAVGDFNLDGNLDLAVVNQTSNSVSVLSGNGSGSTFASSTFTVTSGSSPTAIAATDLNGDGRLDLVIAESNNNRVDIYKGNGDGTFTLQRTLATGNSPMSIVPGDFNTDGNIDLAVANFNSATASILLGNGDFTFQTQSTAPAGTNPFSITSGDFNGDGTADVAVANSTSNNVSILLNQLTDTATASFTGIDIPGNGSTTIGHNIEATYPGDTNFNASTSGTVSLQSTKISTSTLLSSSTTSSTFGQQVVFTATLVPSLVGALTPSGNVTFKNGGTTLGTAAVSGGVATLNVTSLPVGVDSITATYAGDSNFITSTSPALGVTVSKATPVITWANPTPITYGTVLSGTQLNAATTVPGTFAYNQPASTLLSVGTYTLSTTFTPTDSTDYTIATASVTLVVNIASPQINWPAPAPISFGTPLSGIQLNATVSVYNIVPLSSFYNVSGIYTDGASFGSGGFDGGGSAYSSNLLGTSVKWNNITFPLGPANAPDAVSNTTISLPAGHYASLNMLGALVNNAAAGNNFVVTYTDGTTATVTQSLSDWVYPLNYSGETGVTCVPYRDTSGGGQDAHLTCVYGYQIPLDSTKVAQSIQLPTTRNVVMLAMALVSPPIPGTLVYTPPSGTILPTGTNTLTAAFTPTDQTDFANATASVQELVNPAVATSIVWPTPAPITYGTALSSTQLNASAQTVPGTTAVSLAPYYRVNAFQSDGSVFSTGGFDIAQMPSRQTSWVLPLFGMGKHIR